MANRLAAQIGLDFQLGQFPAGENQLLQVVPQGVQFGADVGQQRSVEREDFHRRSLLSDIRSLPRRHNSASNDC